MNRENSVLNERHDPPGLFEGFFLRFALVRRMVIQARPPSQVRTSFPYETCELIYRFNMVEDGPGQGPHREVR